MDIWISAKESGRLASEGPQVLAVSNLPFCRAVSSAWIVLVVHMHTRRSKTFIISLFRPQQGPFKQNLGKSHRPSIEANVWKTWTTLNRLRTLLASARAPPRCRPALDQNHAGGAYGYGQEMNDAVWPHPWLADDESTFPNCCWMFNLFVIKRSPDVRQYISEINHVTTWKERWNSESAKCFFSRKDLWRGRFPLLAGRADASTNTTFT